MKRNYTEGVLDCIVPFLVVLFIIGTILLLYFASPMAADRGRKTTQKLSKE